MKTFLLVVFVWGFSFIHISPKTGNVYFKSEHEAEKIDSCGSEASLRTQMIDLINQARSRSRQCGDLRFSSAPPLIWSIELERAAETHSRHMASHNFFAHRGPDSTHVGHRVQAVGYNWRVVGENIFAGIESAREAVYGWLESPPHCKNIMNPDFEEIGAACVNSSSSQYESYWTQVFAAPMN